MADLVTLSEAKEYLRVDHDYDDALIGMLITAASDAVCDVATDWDGGGVVPARLKLAVLTRVSVTYDERDSMEPGKGELAMLIPLRTLEV